jgi:hypothetical protein
VAVNAAIKIRAKILAPVTETVLGSRVYTLTNPITVGDLTNPITVDKLELASVSLNFEPIYADKGTAILSIVLVHRASGYNVNVVYSDATALSFWSTLNTANSLVTKSVFAKMTADNKLPAGTLS